MHLTPLTRALIPACAAVNAAANAEDDLYNWLQPQLKRYPDALYKYSLGELRGLLCTPGLVVIVAVSDDADEWWDDERGEEALGYATWKRRDGGREERAWRWELEARMNAFERYLLRAEKTYTSVLGLDRSADRARLAKLKAIWESFDDTIVAKLNPEDGRGHIWLANLFVDPRFQRRGVGTRLMRWGMRHADRARVAVGLIASPKGLGLYRKFGFKEFAWIECGPLRDPAMVRAWEGEEESDGGISIPKIKSTYKVTDGGIEEKGNEVEDEGKEQVKGAENNESGSKTRADEIDQVKGVDAVG